ncbi:conserved hypothetical protein [Frankia canadensis]|uniref:Enoyl reductase (ER) domain-containing protein n=1 Tax=Frankia canadensis TaxID=1836972 RepID=A0A2I2KVA0_9ACTN|nr:NADP-dependent oxidoreductase [Frankia canadensis]SNQ49597.1 conserved hypothetical protein [Frankia canadensis]SOU56887.1 conserved hypothetical protein [Frankia canadensis]
MPNSYVYTAAGGPEVEAFADLPRPTPGEGELLVAVRAAGVNPADWKLRGGFRIPGMSTTYPMVFGLEVAGTVVEVGPGVDGFAVGDDVFGNPSTGGYAEFTLLPAAAAARRPAALSFTDAAALPVAGGTAYDGLAQLALPPGATLLVTGVGGGVGVAVAQLARHGGLRVLGTASEAKREFVGSLGVVHVAYGPGTVERLRAAAPDGVDAVYDLVGGAALEEAAELLADRSKLITAADRVAAAKLGGAGVERDRSGRVYTELARLAVDGVLDPRVSATYPLSQAGAALRAVEDGHAQGKIVIEVAP